MILENLSLIVAVTENTNAIGLVNNLLYFIKKIWIFSKKNLQPFYNMRKKTFEGFKIKLTTLKRRNIILLQKQTSILKMFLLLTLWKNCLNL